MQAHSEIHWWILVIIITSTAVGSIHIIKRNYLRYGIITAISLCLSILLCIFFYSNGFYRFVFPLPFILPAVAVSFTYLVLFSICYKPKFHSFAFYFMTINIVFALEIVLKYFFRFIVYRGPWDTWDSYTLYWFYIRFFAFLGDWLVPLKYRKPIPSDIRTYWVMFFVVMIGTIFGFLFVLNQWHVR